MGVVCMDYPTATTAATPNLPPPLLLQLCNSGLPSHNTWSGVDRRVCGQPDIPRNSTTAASDDRGHRLERAGGCLASSIANVFPRHLCVFPLHICVFPPHPWPPPFHLMFFTCRCIGVDTILSASCIITTFPISLSPPFTSVHVDRRVPYLKGRAACKNGSRHGW